MESRTTLVALCCVSLVLLNATAFKINDFTETKVKDTGSEESVEELEVGTKKTAVELPAAQQLAVQNHGEEEVEVDTAEHLDEALSSFSVKDTDGRSKFINNQYIPDDFSNINPKPVFDFLQEETNQQNPPKPLATTYDHFGTSTVVWDEATEVKAENTFKYPKPTKPPIFVSRPIAQSSKVNTLNKGPIKFKTVSTGSQFVVTPVANLLLKLEISIAQPSQPISDDGTIEIGQ